MEISKTKLLSLSSLQLKKHRRAQRLFVVEGTKAVLDTLPHFGLHCLVALQSWIDSHPGAAPDSKLYSASEQQLKKLSSLTTPPPVVAVYDMPESSEAQWLEGVDSRLTLLLDGIQDPGNMGTIIRVADWFGVRHIAASPDTVDIYNNKTIQASMGAISRVKVHYCDLHQLISAHPQLPVYGTLLEGDDIYATDLKNLGFVIMGNEGNGISPALRTLITDALRIPSYPPGEPTSESLNVAIATAVTLAEFRRRL